MESPKCRKFLIIFVDISEKMRIISSCMDTKTDGMIPNCGDLAVLRNHKVLVGAKQIRKALEKDTALYVFLARNADPAITGPIEARCIAHQISCAWVPSMADLGKACGIDGGAAAAAAVK